MNAMRLLRLGLILGLFSGVGSEAEEPDVYAEFMEASGLNSQFADYVDNYAPLVESGLARYDVSRKRAARLASTFRNCFKKEVLLESISTALRDELNEGDARTALSWLSSPAGQEFTRAEIASSDISLADEYAKFRETAKDLPAGRRAIAISLEQVLDNSELVIQNQAMLAASIELAAASARGDAATRPPREIESEVSELMRRKREGIVENRVDFYLFTYRSISDEKLRLYLDHMRSDVVQRYERAVYRALVVATRQCHEGFRAKVLDIFPPPPPQDIQRSGR
jgi:hypothetical protein